jgi:hypothetical protein
MYGTFILVFPSESLGGNHPLLPPKLAHPAYVPTELRKGGLAKGDGDRTVVLLAAYVPEELRSKEKKGKGRSFGSLAREKIPLEF